MGSGHTTAHYSYAPVNVVLAIIGSVMATGGSFSLLYHGQRETAPAGAAASPYPVPAPAAAVLQGTESGLVLRLLEGDERTMFRAVLDKGGEAFQKDLVAATGMSDAKVSRVLDRLEEKGLVARERHGMTNKVRAQIEH